MKRAADAREWLDDPAGDAAALARNLREQAWLNRWLLGEWAVRRHALPFLQRCPSAPVCVLEVGCGGADVLRGIVRWARHAQREIQAVGLDCHPGVIACAADGCREWPEISLVQGDARRPPFVPHSIDLVLLPNLLHHLTPAEGSASLQAATHISRGMVVATDLCRSPTAVFGLRLLLALGRFGDVTRYDGPLSIRRAYTPTELASLAHAAGLTNWRLYRYPLWRMALVYQCSGRKYQRIGSDIARHELS